MEKKSIVSQPICPKRCLTYCGASCNCELNGVYCNITIQKPKTVEEFFFTTYLTENEHDAIKNMISNWCAVNESHMLYYRKFKNGHVPMWRECKISGKVGEFINWLKEEKIWYNNYHKDIKFIEEHGWRKLNARRIELIEKKLSDTLNSEEEEELKKLKRIASFYVSLL